eukprot:242673-Rhodomonas_salina.4
MVALTFANGGTDIRECGAGICEWRAQHMSDAFMDQMLDRLEVRRRRPCFRGRFRFRVSRRDPFGTETTVGLLQRGLLFG